MGRSEGKNEETYRARELLKKKPHHPYGLVSILFTIPKDEGALL